MSYKATKPGLVSVLYLNMRYTVLLFIRAPFYVSLVFVATRSGLDWTGLDGVMCGTRDQTVL